MELVQTYLYYVFLHRLNLGAAFKILSPLIMHLYLPDELEDR